MYFNIIASELGINEIHCVIIHSQAYHSHAIILPVVTQSIVD